MPGLHELAMIKMQQVCHAANKVFLVFVDTAVGKGNPPDTLQQGLLLLLIQMIVNLPGKLIQRCGVFGVGEGIVQDFLSLFPGNLMSLTAQSTMVFSSRSSSWLSTRESCTIRAVAATAS